MARPIVLGKTKPGLERVLGRGDLILLFVVAVANLNLVPAISASGPITLWLWMLALISFFVPQGVAVTELALWGRRQQSRSSTREGYLAGVVAAARIMASLEQVVVLGHRFIPVGASIGLASLLPGDPSMSAADMLHLTRNLNLDFDTP